MSYVQTEMTPNPDALKFLLEVPIMPEGKTLNCSSLQQASVSPLAMELFSVEGVKNVFLGHDFITITKEERMEWLDLNIAVIGVVMAFVASKQPVIKEFSFAPEEMVFNDPLSMQIEAILEEKIRPAIAQDGGNVVFRGFQEGVVYLELQGSCSGCPSSSMTLKMGIENMLKYYVPEVLMVEQI